jgi:hypothetical protein
VGGPDPIQGVWIPFQGSDSHTWRSWTKLGGPDRIYRGSAPSHRGPDGLTGDASEYVSFSGHVAAPDPPMWWGQVLLLAQSSRLRLGQVMA